MGTQATTRSRASEPKETRRHEVLGILVAAGTVLTALALWSYDARGGENLIGPAGHALADMLVVVFGVAAWVAPLELSLFTFRLFAAKPSPLGVANTAATLTIMLIGCALTHLALPETQVFGGHLPGGVLGELLGELLRSLLGLTGAFVVGIALVLITVVLRSQVSVLGATRLSLTSLVERVTQLWRSAFESVQALSEAWREAKELEREEREAQRKADEPRVVKDGRAKDDDDYEEPADHLDEDFDDDDDLFEEDDEDELEPPPVAAKSKAKLKAPDAEPEPIPEAVVIANDPVPPRKAKRTSQNEAPVIVAPSPESEQQLPVSKAPKPSKRDFQIPETDLLDPVVNAGVQLDHETLKRNAAQLMEKLEAYGVHGRVDEIHPGPVVTMYEFEPKSGTKVSKIAGLTDDLAMSLAAQKVRIVAPIPGKARVGFELPNEKRQTVPIRQILEDERWQKLSGPLPIALGKDIAGQPVYGDLSKMPHMLVAGATGAGKSVGLNVMLASLLFKRSPDEVRLLMIDPKVVELAVYDGIPHMLLPVVTDMNKASLALRWAVDEMERRYQLFADAGARNVSTYNQRVEKVLKGEMSIAKLWPSKAGKVRTIGPNGEEMWVRPDGDEQPTEPDPPEKLPYVVVVVDEFADLMMVAAKDVEAAVARLAQKARAAGIHVILATQRPSVDVITGMIKANFPARIAFKVSQREDSKTILGRQGAEHLLGMGDMLMIPPGSSDLKRVHSAYISEDEVKRLCDELREQGAPVYDENILKPRDEEDGGGFEGPKTDDPQYDKAVAFVANAGYCSISGVQRAIGVGYNKAAKMVERMEKEGVVGPASGKAGGRREVLIQPL